MNLTDSPFAAPPQSVIATAVNETILGREIFENISAASQKFFYLLALLALLAFAWGVWQRVQLWQIGRREGVTLAWGDILRRVLRDVFFQRRVLMTRRKASRGHVLLFWSFLTLFAGTTLIAIEHFLAAMLGREPSRPVFHHGAYYAVYEVVMDLAGLGLVWACWVLGRRRLTGGGSFERRGTDLLVLGMLMFLGLSGYVVEGLRILAAETRLPGFSFAGYSVSRVIGASGLPIEGAVLWHQILWWVHAVVALAFVGMFPYVRLFHALAGTLRLATRDETLGELKWIEPAVVEQSGRIGVGEVRDFTQRQLMSLDACVSCGRCEDRCPAHEAGRPLSPRRLVLDIRGDVERFYASGGSELHGKVISAETLWSCTTCLACTDVCPLGVDPADLIIDMRRFLIGEGQLRGSPATALERTGRGGNPWGMPAEDRMAWAEGLGVLTVEEQPDFEWLYWVGCAASYDRRIRRVARSFVRLMQHAGVRFSVLGRQERCSGEFARRMGDELLFQELAAHNLAALTRGIVRRIVTHCPHCLNSLRSDYRQAGGDFEVVHHTQLLARLIDQGRLKLEGVASGPGVHDGGNAKSSITYHDPCYLARVQGVTAAPRDVLGAALGDRRLKEMRRRGAETACCGAGGGRMWFDDPPDERIGRGRVQEALDTGAATVAVACPFCLIMVGDAVKATGADVPVVDVAEMLAESLGLGEGA